MPWITYVIISITSSSNIFIGLLHVNSSNLSYHKHTSKLYSTSVIFVCCFFTCAIFLQPDHKNGIPHLGTHLSNGHVKVSVSFSVVSDPFATPWTVALQAPLSVGFSRQEYWSGVPFPPPADLPNPGIEPGAPVLQADFFLPSEPWWVREKHKYSPHTPTYCQNKCLTIGSWQYSSQHGDTVNGH